MYVGHSHQSLCISALNGQLMATSSGCNMHVSPLGIMAISVFVFFIDLHTSSAECALNEANTSRLLLLQPELSSLWAPISEPYTDDTQSVISSVSVLNYNWTSYCLIGNMLRKNLKGEAGVRIKHGFVALKKGCVVYNVAAYLAAYIYANTACI